MFSFSSDAELDEWPTSDADADDASFAWRSSSVPDMDIGLRTLVVAAGGDFVAERPRVEGIDGTHARDMPVGDIVVERMRAVEAGPSSSSA